jgi:Domain of unknown function (DUF1708)
VTLLPRALEALLNATEYPPTPKAQHQIPSSKVAMIVETVSPTPFALLRRAKDFRYRDEDAILQRFSDFEDPSEALTDECRRVLRAISSANDTSSAKTSTSLKDPSWSRFEDIGFSTLTEDSDENEPSDAPTISMPMLRPGLQSAPQSRVDLGRPTTPSWADFLSTGFVDEKYSHPAVLLPPDKVLPPLNMRAHSSQSQRRMTDDSSSLEPGELANITRVVLDDAFWWTWITSLAGEEAPARKAVFGRCALIETRIYGSSWLVMEEIVKGAAPEPQVGTYVAEKKSRFTFRKNLSRSKTSAKGANMPRGVPSSKIDSNPQPNKKQIAPDQQARIQAAAAALQERKRQEATTAMRRGRLGESSQQKTQSVATLQSTFVREAAPAMKWANSYDKNTIRAKYLGNEFTGRGSAVDLKEVLGAGDAIARAAQSPVPEERSTDVASPESKTPTDRTEKPAAALPPRDSSLQRETEQAAAAQPRTPPTKTASGDREDGTSPQAATFFASQMPGVGQQKQESKPLPTKRALPQPESRPPPPPKEEKPAATARPGIRPRPAQRGVEQRATPPKQKVAQSVEEKATPPPMVKPEEAKTEVSKNQATLQQAVSKSSADPERAPSTPDPSNQAAAESPSPEASKTDRNKLRKKNQTVGKGIKTMFKLKKTDEEPKPAPQPARSPPSATSSSVAAARAALEAKAKEGQVSSPSPTNRVTTKRYSTAGKNGVLEEAAPSKPVAREEPRSSPRPGPRAEPTPQPHEREAPAAGADRPTSTAQSSQVDPAEEKRAQEAFGSFDQGGVEPNTPTHAEAPGKEKSEALQPSTAPAAASADKPTETAAAAETAPEESEESVPPAVVAPAKSTKEDASETIQSTGDPGDRWAQIRKNAAERAARMSEEQSTGRTARTSRTDDDGETSGEESK